MDAIILLPGILGSRLSLDGEEVWPPTVAEMKFGYGRVAQLLDDRVRPTGLIERVWCHQVYAPIISDLRQIGEPSGNDPGRTIELLAYDWRKDIRRTSATLRDKLRELADAGAARIAIVAHSMGGLIARLTLEDAANRAEPWFDKVDLFAALAVPHLGAPVAIARAIGIDGTMGLAGRDVREMGADPRYPALYQLLPAPGQQAVWRTARGEVAAVDFYDPGIAEALGLDPANLAVAKATYGLLDPARKPQRARYVSLGGSGHSTCIRIEMSRLGPRKIDAEDAGDGTVPLWSAISGLSQYNVAPGEHSAVFRSDELRDVLYRLFGRRPPALPFAAGDGKPRVRLSTNDLVYRPNAPIEVLVIPMAPTPSVAGDLEIKGTTDAESQPLAPVSAPIPVAYAGPPITTLRLQILAPAQVGQYEIGFRGSHSSEPVDANAQPGSAYFAVTSGT
jgi:hypothetical protein